MLLLGASNDQFFKLNLSTRQDPTAPFSARRLTASRRRPLFVRLSRRRARASNWSRPIACRPRSTLSPSMSSLPRPTRSGSAESSRAHVEATLPHVSWIEVTQLSGREGPKLLQAERSEGFPAREHVIAPRCAADAKAITDLALPAVAALPSATGSQERHWGNTG